jgi:peptidoglycan/LPS O-acetylase OafA/YrhL
MQERPRLDTLDGLRGLAALMVMVHHAGPNIAAINPLPCGYLAVDFFFLLSGFVIARCYEDRLAGNLSASDFFQLRLTRLYPTMMLGIFGGALTALYIGSPVSTVAQLLVLEALFVPVLDTPNGIYILDGVQWSLAFELVANLLHAMILRRLGTRGLLALAAGLYLLLALASWHYGSLAMGDRGATTLGGIPRCLSSYVAGIALYRMDRARLLPRVQISSPLLFSSFMLLIVAAGWCRTLGISWWLEPLIAAAAFPPLLVAAADARLSATPAAIARLAGRLSYPLYALHLPVITATRLLAGRSLLLNRPSAMIAAIAVALILSAGAARLLGEGGLARRRPAGRRRYPHLSDKSPSPLPFLPRSPI